ncbi:hypothetical protein CJ030_MR8G028811 [Morella rubra]|uniref:Uncharacterized protein n=1 Tax=Morella rubra TaxID=262757 RepID=A0A6A1USD9_9ROSI|nr:hypothetical protein CJ030_MR8G028811 [Morella rubra]
MGHEPQWYLKGPSLPPLPCVEDFGLVDVDPAVLHIVPLLRPLQRKDLLGLICAVIPACVHTITIGEPRGSSKVLRKWIPESFNGDSSAFPREEMMRLFALRDPEKVDLKVAEQVFHEVLGHKSGHVRGLENSAIPKPSPTSRSSHWGGEFVDESELVGNGSPLLTNGHRQLRDTVGKGPTNIDGVPQTSPNVFHGGQSFNGADGNLWSSAKVCLHATTSTRARRRLTVEDGLLRRNTAFLPQLLLWAYAVFLIVDLFTLTFDVKCRNCHRNLQRHFLPFLTFD